MVFLSFFPCLDELFINMDEPVLKVYTVPFKTNELSDPHPGKNCDDEKRTIICTMFRLDAFFI